MNKLRGTLTLRGADDGSPTINSWWPQTVTVEKFLLGGYLFSFTWLKLPLFIPKEEKCSTYYHWKEVKYMSQWLSNALIINFKNCYILSCQSTHPRPQIYTFEAHFCMCAHTCAHAALKYRPHKDPASCPLLLPRQCEGSQQESDNLLPVIPVSWLVGGQRGDMGSR